MQNAFVSFYLPMHCLLGELGSSLRELLLVRLGRLQEALGERVGEIKPGLHFSLCRLDLHCWLVNEYNQVAAFCGQSG